ncbi:MAG: methyltransferase domain-containing protein, partial [Patescibacteria group bacterium]
VPLVKRMYRLGSDDEFFTRYALAIQGFEELWKSRSRESREDIEHFYQEHDKDIWRQAFLSERSYEYKQKILHTYHIIKEEGLSHSDPILDYGGGAGVLVHYLAREGYRAVDMADIPSHTLSFVRQTMSDLLAHVITVDGLEDFGRERYAVIVSLACLEHTLEPLNITRKLVAALRRGGLFIVDFPVETDFLGSHTRQAQEQRPAAFVFLRETCEELVPYHLYRRKR